VLPAATAFACQRACKQQDHFATQITATKNRLQAIDRFVWPGLEEQVFADPFAPATRFFREHCTIHGRWCRLVQTLFANSGR